MPAQWTSQLNQFRAGHERASAAGLIAAAYEVRSEVMRTLMTAYTTRAFNTGESVRHVTVGPVTRDGDALAIRVGTDLLYNLYWELGHWNHFTRRYERVELWRTAYEASRERAMAAFRAAYAAAMPS